MRPNLEEESHAKGRTAIQNHSMDGQTASSFVGPSEVNLRSAPSFSIERRERETESSIVIHAVNEELSTSFIFKLKLDRIPFAFGCLSV